MGCAEGVGVGLDASNRVDMLISSMPAAKVLQIGDRIVTWNGVVMIDAEGQTRPLKDVVTGAADSHVLFVERARSPTIDGMVRRDPLTEEEMNVDNDKEEAVLWGLAALALAGFLVANLGTFSQWVPNR